METISGFEIRSKRYAHWAARIEEWLLLNERYCRVVGDGEAAFHYTERACVGVVAGAAWRCGEVALEAFQFEKSSDEGQKWNGRVDLWIATNGREEYIEAKAGWVSLLARTPVAEQLSRVVQSASEDAKEVIWPTRKSTRFTGLAFCPIWISGKQQEKLEERIYELLDTAKKLNSDVTAWFFPSILRNKKDEQGKIYPGVILLANAVSRS